MEIRLSVGDLQLAEVVVIIAIVLIALGYWDLRTFVVLLVGEGIATFPTGILPPTFASILLEFLERLSQCPDGCPEQDNIFQQEPPHFRYVWEPQVLLPDAGRCT